MTTVAQMIEWMQTLPPDAEVECGVEVTGVTGSFSTYMTMKPVDISYSRVIDYTSEADRAKYPNMAGKTLVMIQA